MRTLYHLAIQLVLLSGSSLSCAFGWSPNFCTSFEKRDSCSKLYSCRNDASQLPTTTTGSASNTRRSFLNKAIGSVGIVTLPSFSNIGSASAAEEEKRTLKKSLYLILRVREATSQETRLISTGKFKDVQRANVKLAVKFMISNYRLSDSLNIASSYLEGNRRIDAGNIGQQAVESLYTILEYFDSSDVQNIKVGDSMAGKEALVLKGLETTRSRIDDFIDLFPSEVVDDVRAQIKDENALNAQEFDPAIGTILNPNPTKS